MVKQILWFFIVSGLLILYDSILARFCPRPDFDFASGHLLSSYVLWRQCFKSLALMIATLVPLTLYVALWLSDRFFQKKYPAPGGTYRAEPATPLTPKNGSWGDKGSDDDIEARMTETGFTHSTRFQESLDIDFPPGAPDKLLRQMLCDRKYRGVGVTVYQNDPTICSAISPPHFIVFWKCDPSTDGIVWTKAFERLYPP